jgi:hypothetical protein
LFHSAPYDPHRSNARPDTLSYRTKNRTEIAGVSSGHFPVWGRPLPSPPLDAWARGEAARIRAAGAREAWVFFIPFSVADAPVLDALSNAIRAAGGVPQGSSHRREAHLLRFRFD